MRRLVAFAAVGLWAGAAAADGPVVGFPFDFPIVVQGELTPTGPTGPIDLRFFGTFCQPSPREFCKSIPVLPDPCVTLRDLRLQLDHLTAPDGGLLSGTGGFVLDGDRGTLSAAGSIVQRGFARFTAQAPGLGQQSGDATLSGDGLEMVATVQDRTLVLRKDACGNAAPAVTLTALGGPTFPHATSVVLVSHVTDEDDGFPELRVVFTSNRQGALPGYRPHSQTLMTTALQPGSHRVTVTVTDSGGLTGQASVDLTVVNQPPDNLAIFLPGANATLLAEAPVLLQGHAYDEGGWLAGGALAWSAQTTPGGPFAPLGFGTELGTSFAEPADPVVIRLTATDSAGEQAFLDRVVRVVPSTGNAPPVVAIREPNRLESIGQLAGGAASGLPFHLLATAGDVEDAPGDLETTWEFVALEGLGGAPDPTPPVPNPAPITGDLAPDVTFSVVGDVYYRITFTATDSGGASSLRHDRDPGHLERHPLAGAGSSRRWTSREASASSWSPTCRRAPTRSRPFSGSPTACAPSGPPYGSWCATSRSSAEAVRGTAGRPRNSTAAATTSGSVRIRRWPSPRVVSKRAPGQAATRRAPSACATSRSVASWKARRAVPSPGARWEATSWIGASAKRRSRSERTRWAMARERPRCEAARSRKVQGSSAGARKTARSGRSPSAIARVAATAPTEWATTARGG